MCGIDAFVVVFSHVTILQKKKKIHECMIFSSCVCNEKEVDDRGLETAVLRGSHAYNKRNNSVK